jgi:hypothetical protein
MEPALVSVAPISHEIRYESASSFPIYDELWHEWGSWLPC